MPPEKITLYIRRLYTLHTHLHIITHAIIDRRLSHREYCVLLCLSVLLSPLCSPLPLIALSFSTLPKVT